jgi:hypothetical protein
MNVLASMDAVFIMFGVGSVLLMAAAAFIWQAKVQKRIRENWTAFAHAHGMHYTGNTRSGMHGVFGNTPVKICTRTEGSGKNQVTYTDFITDLGAPLPNGLAFHRETFMSRLGRAFGTQDIQVGDAALDQALIIQGSDVPGIVRLLTTPEVRTAILSTFARHSDLRLRNGQLTVTRTGTIYARADLNAMGQALDYVAQTINIAANEIAGHAPVVQPPPPLVQQTRRRPRPQNTAARAPAPAAAAAAVPAAVAAPAPQPVAAAAPAPVPEVAPEPAPPPQPEPKPAPADRPDFAAFAARLGERSLLSARRDEILREHADIRWPLTVSVESVSRTFGFSLPEELRDGRTVEGSVGGVNVHVRLPKDRSEEVRNLRRGDTFTAEAKAVAWDDLFKRVTLDG